MKKEERRGGRRGKRRKGKGGENMRRRIHTLDRSRYSRLQQLDVSYLYSNHLAKFFLLVVFTLSL